MLLPFTKMHGLGNDFIVFDVPDDSALPSADTFKQLGNRRTGIGFDQALALFPPRSREEDVSLNGDCPPPAAVGLARASRAR